jgi:hypothetical protein
LKGGNSMELGKDDIDQVFDSLEDDMNEDETIDYLDETLLDEFEEE